MVVVMVSVVIVVVVVVVFAVVSPSSMKIGSLCNYARVLNPSNQP
jgi:hypothetical protein